MQSGPPHTGTTIVYAPLRLTRGEPEARGQKFNWLARDRVSSGGKQYMTRSGWPAVEMALDHINNNTDVLL
ncbi:hypothetical protein PRIPAC_95464 [Pristionchus pacificus]|uniref:Uncharacterized protein n=1 Tax=Pristionchus pacificus TaxID=54126 RepID=A0A2A6BJT1_PRIPA|nr:hypothetical protein PRIPAC_95464 [Pristionchus pacificus]|eukprot:PDM66093.1 hypothetical protein PRIPAC_45318 [Pristionchus pacificus]